ncbi:hypothetical protein, conserved [Leishmania tarentolae]|uniref:Flagellum targeting protein kharon1 n=1 Tax=Leishmania tarentolae TaxID=5689 RepID=A0A640KXF6_LEITA|nr:hypothetical protein, conserved [Leishmania tarentolae]
MTSVMAHQTSPPRSGEPASMSTRQRARQNRSGENAARLLMGMDLANEDAERKPNTGRQHCAAPRNNFSSPCEFFGGPRHPPRMVTGIRRNPNSNADSVGMMLTDEYFMKGSDNVSAGPNRGAQRRKSSYGSASFANGAYGAPAKRGEGQAREKKARRKINSKNASSGPFHCQDGLTNNCIVTAPEAPWRCGVKITHPQGVMEAPYFEDNDPRPPRDTPPVTGKRHLKPPHRDAPMFGQIGHLTETEEEQMQGVLPPCHKTSNRANESVDVLNLHCYTADELNERPQPFKQLGPRKCSAQELPPKKPPVIRPINTPAKQEHDVLGTGRWGSPEKEQPRGLGRGSCRPPRDTANLFHGGVMPRDDRYDSRRCSTQAGSQRSSSRRNSRASRPAPRSSRAVQPYYVNSRNGSPRKREDPVFEDNYRPHKIMFKKNAGTPNLLRYYDPTIDPAPASPPKGPIPRSNMESKLDDSNTPYVMGKGRGEFYQNSQSTIALV